MLNKLIVAVSVIGTTLLACSLAQAQDPTKLRIAGILSAGKEAPWESSFVSSMDRVIAAKPHGLDIEVNYTENVSDNAEQVFRTYAETGDYDILFGDTAYVDAIEKLKDEFPNTMFVMSGSGNRGLGGNAYWLFVHAHEPAYVMGQLAGKLTKTNVVGAVSTFPAEDTNDQINAFFEGAKDANSAVKQKITFIQSWFDPTKSNEATSAQIAVGSDMIYQMSGGLRGLRATRHRLFRQLCRHVQGGAEVDRRLDHREVGSAHQLDHRPMVEGQDDGREIRCSDGAEMVHLEGRFGRPGDEPGLGSENPRRRQEARVGKLAGLAIRPEADRAQRE